MADNNIPINKFPYCKPVKNWLCERYGSDRVDSIWEKTVEQYNAYLPDLPDYGGKKITERGNHETLMAQKGTYANMVSLQEV